MWRLRCSDSGRDSASPMVRALSKDLFSLNNHVGRHTWEFDASAGTAAEKEAVECARATFAKYRHTQQHSADELLRMQYDAMREARGRLITVTPPPTSSYDAPSLDAREAVPRAVVDRAMRAGIDFYQGLQDTDGHWASDYGGPMFLVPGLVISLYVVGELETTLDEHARFEMRRYLRNHQNEDGGFGLHIEGHSTMFGTVLSYVAMRLLGVDETGLDPTSGETHGSSRAAARRTSRAGASFTCASWARTSGRV
jgi:cycloartenol synthase